MDFRSFFVSKALGLGSCCPPALAAWLTQGFLTFSSAWEGDDQSSKSCGSATSRVWCLPLLLPSKEPLARLLQESIWGRRGDASYISQALAGCHSNRATHSCQPCHHQSEQTSPQRLRGTAERKLQAGNRPKERTECSSWISTLDFQISSKFGTWGSEDRHSVQDDERFHWGM